MKRILFDENMPRKLRREVVVIETVDTTLGNLRRFLPQIHVALERVTPGEVVIVKMV